MGEPRAVKVILKIPKPVDTWLKAKGYSGKEYQKMFNAALVGELDYLDRQGTRELRKLLEKD